MARFSGPYAPVQGAVSYTSSDGKLHYRTKGIMRQYRIDKRREAEERNARTPYMKRRAFAKANDYDRISDIPDRIRVALVAAEELARLGQEMNTDAG